MQFYFVIFATWVNVLNWFRLSSSICWLLQNWVRKSPCTCHFHRGTDKIKLLFLKSCFFLHSLTNPGWTWIRQLILSTFLDKKRRKRMKRSETQKTCENKSQVTNTNWVVLTKRLFSFIVSNLHILNFMALGTEAVQYTVFIMTHFSLVQAFCIDFCAKFSVHLWK